MKKRTKEPFRNSELDRARPKRHIFHSLLYDKSKRHRTDTGLVEDSTSSTTIVRIIGGLLLVHLVVIGGVLLRGHMVKSNSGVAVAPTITPPPAVQQAPAPSEEVLPQPTAPQVAPAAAAKPASAAPAANHITQAPAQDAAVAEVAPAEPVLLTPPPAPQAAQQPEPAAPAAAAQKTVKHYVSSGDTWYGIATQYGISVEELQAANPKSAQKNKLFSGTYLDVPAKADAPATASAPAEQVAEPAAPAAKVHKVKRGETLKGISIRHNISLEKLLKLNNLTIKDARRIRVGMELKVSE